MQDKGPVKIIHVPRRFTTNEWGGTETVILQISRQQKREGQSPVIMTSMALDNRRDEIVDGVPVVRFPYCYPYLGLTPENKAAMDKKGGNLVSLPLFWELWRSRDARVFHAHTLKRMGGEVRTAARLLKKPFVVSLHGGVFDVPAVELDTLLRPTEKTLEWGRPLGALFGSRRVLEDADHVVCVGKSELEKAREHLPHTRISYLPNGVDCGRFRQGDGSAFRKKHGIPPDSFLIINISRIDAQKNQRLLVEAFCRFKSTHPSSHLLIIGPETQPDYAAGLRSILRGAAMGDAVKILPGLRNDDPDLVNAFHACDVFVLPSIHEPFGIVVLEAWSAGRPVVASRVGGLQSLIKNNETGLLIDPAEVEAAGELADKLDTLAAEPITRRRLGEAGRKEAINHYDWPQIHRQLEDIYLEAEDHSRHRYGQQK